jgi:quinol monooxygenase YgiN
MTEVNVGLLVRIEALPGKEDEVAQFLTDGLELVLEEPGTTEWFAIRMGPSTFGIFDTFADDDGREAHLNGKVAAALMDSVGKTISEPQIEKVDIIAAKLEVEVDVPVL